MPRARCCASMQFARRVEAYASPAEMQRRYVAQPRRACAMTRERVVAVKTSTTAMITSRMRDTMPPRRECQRQYEILRRRCGTVCAMPPPSRFMMRASLPRCVARSAQPCSASRTLCVPRLLSLMLRFDFLPLLPPCHAVDYFSLRCFALISLLFSLRHFTMLLCRCHTTPRGYAAFHDLSRLLIFRFLLRLPSAACCRYAFTLPAITFAAAFFTCYAIFCRYALSLSFFAVSRRHARFCL